MSNELQAVQTINTSRELSVQEMQHHVAIIDQMTRAVMKEGMHYGKIPGCGDKPTLLQPGAQKLALAFQLSVSPEVEWNDLPGGHREYHVRCHLITRNGITVGTGLGNCGTMESRYRFRTQNTGREVPKGYWETRDAMQLGGPQFSAKKIEGEWKIIEKIEHDNPADYYNTCEKMAKKRAFIDAILTCTAASDHFTQDIEDNPELYGGGEATRSAKPAAAQAATGGNESDPLVTFGKHKGKRFSELDDGYLSWLVQNAQNPKYGQSAEAELARRKKTPPAASGEASGRASEEEIRHIRRVCEDSGLGVAELLEACGLSGMDKIRACDVQPILRWLEDPHGAPELPAF